MPMSDPLKVRISPKAMSTEWWISPIGCARNPHASNAHPKAHIATDTMSWVFLMLWVVLGVTLRALAIRGAR